MPNPYERSQAAREAERGLRDLLNKLRNLPSPHGSRAGRRINDSVGSSSWLGEIGSSLRTVERDLKRAGLRDLAEEAVESKVFFEGISLEEPWPAILAKRRCAPQLQR